MDELLKMLFAFSWVWIPIVAILAGAFSEWLKFKEKQHKLGASAVVTEKKLADLERRLDEQQKQLVQRVQNLEAIVTTQVWDAVAQEPFLPEKRDGTLLEARLDLEPLDLPEEADRDRAAALARRLRS